MLLYCFYFQKQSNDLQKFINQLLKLFPYSQEETGQKSKSKCLTQNLTICHLFCTLNHTLINRYQCECAEKIVAYLESNFSVTCDYFVIYFIVFRMSFKSQLRTGDECQFTSGDIANDFD